jgi:hypothetical protein
LLQHEYEYEYDIELDEILLNLNDLMKKMNMIFKAKKYEILSHIFLIINYAAPQDKAVVIQNTIAYASHITIKPITV